MRLEEAYEHKDIVCAAIKAFSEIMRSANDTFQTVEGQEEFAALLTLTAKDVFASPVSYVFGKAESGSSKDAVNIVKELSKTTQTLAEAVSKVTSKS